MPRLEHFYGQKHLHYLAANTYRKARIFDSDRFKRKFGTPWMIFGPSWASGLSATYSCPSTATC